MYELRQDMRAAENFSCAFLGILTTEPWLMNFWQLATTYTYSTSLGNDGDGLALNRLALRGKKMDSAYWSAHGCDIRSNGSLVQKNNKYM